MNVLDYTQCGMLHIYTALYMMNDINNAVGVYSRLICCDYSERSSMYVVLLPYKYQGMSRNVGIHQLATLHKNGINALIVCLFRKVYGTSTGLIKPDYSKSWTYP